MSLCLCSAACLYSQFLQRTVFHVRAENSSKSFDEFLEFPGKANRMQPHGSDVASH